MAHGDLQEVKKGAFELVHFKVIWGISPQLNFKFESFLMKTFYGENLIYYCTIGSEKLNCLKKAVTVDPNGPWNCHFGLIGVHVYMYLQIF